MPRGLFGVVVHRCSSGMCSVWLFQVVLMLFWVLLFQVVVGFSRKYQHFKVLGEVMETCKFVAYT